MLAAEFLELFVFLEQKAPLVGVRIDHVQTRRDGIEEQHVVGLGFVDQVFKSRKLFRRIFLPPIGPMFQIIFRRIPREQNFKTLFVFSVVEISNDFTYM